MVNLIDNIRIRNGMPSDYERIITVMPEWWDGRDVTALLPKVFFLHFNNLSYHLGGCSILIKICFNLSRFPCAY